MSRVWETEKPVEVPEGITQSAGPNLVGPEPRRGRKLEDPHVPEIVAIFSLSLGLFVGSLIQMLASLDGGHVWVVVATFAATLLYAGLKVRRYLRRRMS